METTKTLDRFPVTTVILSNLVSTFIYISGLIITLQLTWIMAILYLGLILSFEFRLLSKHCVNCYYWGKRCGFGKGSISSLFFRKGDPSKFCEKTFSWKNLLPDLLISLLPVIIGILLLVIKFSILTLTALVLIIILTTVGNGYVRSSLTCKFCTQRELGCPAEKLFSKTKSNQ